MTKCIGCRCCEVACAEQNGNPLEINWRRVGEIEGGEYPYAQRFYLSMGCNHCLDPSCLSGCPVNAYNKDARTGLVLHSADACIGCGYCTWNCPYGVPQYNPERGVVGKCDMCHGRLSEGREPACVNACPEGDPDRTGEYRRMAARLRFGECARHAFGRSHDLNHAHHTAGPDAQGLQEVNLGHLHTEQPHWPLSVMTVLTQLSVGAFTAIWSMHCRRGLARRLFWPWRIGSAERLERFLRSPIHAARAMKEMSHSYSAASPGGFALHDFRGSLSISSLLATSFTTMTERPRFIWSGWSRRECAALSGAGPPAWNSLFTVFEFFATVATLGFAAGMTGRGRRAPPAC